MVHRSFHHKLYRLSVTSVGTELLSRKIAWRTVLTMSMSNRLSARQPVPPSVELPFNLWNEGVLTASSDCWIAKQEWIVKREGTLRWTMNTKWVFFFSFIYSVYKEALSWAKALNFLQLLPFLRLYVPTLCLGCRSQGENVPKNEIQF